MLKIKFDHLTRQLLILLAITFIVLFIILPVIVIFMAAFKQGLGAYLAAFNDEDAVAAIILSLKVSLLVVFINTFFGILVAWAVTKFDFKYKNILLTLIDIPFSISPVVIGFSFILAFGYGSFIGDFLAGHNINIIFDFPAILLVTLFVTFPYIPRELIILMQEQGQEQEEAALILGANWWQIFWRITMPNIKWALLYGIIITNARALGEFGAVSMVSGHIRGLTTTLPLQVELLYNEYNFVGAFAISSILVLVGFITLIIKFFLKDKLSTNN